MTKWGDDYAKAKGVTVEYESVGSGVGIQRLAAGTFDFGCTDAPMSCGAWRRSVRSRPAAT